MVAWAGAEQLAGSTATQGTDDMSVLLIVCYYVEPARVRVKPEAATLGTKAAVMPGKGLGKRV